MNKKIIAIAIATAMAAPAAMAEINIDVSGTFGGDLVNTTKGDTTGYAADNTTSVTAMEDNGQSQMNFDATSGSAYGHFGFAFGPGANQNEYVIDAQTLTGPALTTANIKASKGSIAYRDYYLGYNLSKTSSVQFGVMAGAMKGLEKDALNATFAQTRGTYAEANTSSNATKSGAYGSGGFIQNLVQYKMEAGSATVTVQLDPTSNNNASANEGHVGLSVAGKAAGINYYAGYNNGAGSDKGQGNAGTAPEDTNMKVGGSMKFGAIKAGLNYTSAKNSTSTWNSVAVSADMSLGKGTSVLATIATMSGDAEGDFSRIAVIKSIGPKARIYGGYTSNKAKGGTAVSQLGLGVSIKF